MSDAAPKKFEEKLERIDEIVRSLESGGAELEEAIALFKEGKKLARECEVLLEKAQEQVNALSATAAEAAREPASGELDDQIPF